MNGNVSVLSRAREAYILESRSCRSMLPLRLASSSAHVGMSVGALRLSTGDIGNCISHPLPRLVVCFQPCWSKTDKDVESRRSARWVNFSFGLSEVTRGFFPSDFKSILAHDWCGPGHHLRLSLSIYSGRYFHYILRLVDSVSYE